MGVFETTQPFNMILHMNCKNGIITTCIIAFISTDRFNVSHKSPLFIMSNPPPLFFLHVHLINVISLWDLLTSMTVKAPFPPVFIELNYYNVWIEWSCMLQLPLQMLMLKIKTCLHLEKAPADKRFIFHKGRFQFWMSDKYTRECIQTLVFLVYGISFFLSIAE